MLKGTLLVALLLVGCGGGGFEGSSAPAACVKGATQSCVCASGMGAQSCLDDQSGWAVCQCAANEDAGTEDGNVLRDPTTGVLVETWTLSCAATGVVIGDTRYCEWTGGSAAAPVSVHKVCNINMMPMNCTSVPSHIKAPAGQAICTEAPDPNDATSVAKFELCNL